MRILVTGSRNWTDRPAMERAIWEHTEEEAPSGVLIVQGGARGADRMAADIARDWGFRHATVPALWASEGRAAGPLRNQQMIDTYEPELCLAFPEGDSKGTWDCMDRCEKAGIRVVNYGCPAALRQ